DAVFAVEPWGAPHVAGAQPGDGLGEQFAADAADVLDRGLAQHVQLRPESRDELVDALDDGFAPGPDVLDLAQDLGELYQMLDHDGLRALRALALRPVGQLVHPVLHADRDRLAAGRADALMRGGLLGGPAHAAHSVPVDVIFALFGEELDGAVQAVAGL